MYRVVIASDIDSQPEFESVTGSFPKVPIYTSASTKEVKALGFELSKSSRTDCQIYPKGTSKARHGSHYSFRSWSLPAVPRRRRCEKVCSLSLLYRLWGRKFER